MTESGFIKAQSDNVPKIDAFMMTAYFASNPDFTSAEVRGVKAARSERESYGDSAVGYVQIKRDGNVCVVKARITPEHNVAMQRNDRWPEDYDPDGSKSRPGSRRGSASLSRRSSAKKEKEKDKEVKKKSPVHQPGSATSTPKKAKPQNLEFVVTGKQCLKKCDRANSLPGYHRRPSVEKTKKPFVSPKRTANVSQSSASKSRETSLEDDMSLDLSQVSDFEDTNSKYGIKNKFHALATSTPKVKVKPRSGSLQTQQRDRKETTFSCSRDSLYKTSSSASPYRYGVSTELDYSSVSPEYSGQSSTEMSPRVVTDLPTPRSQDQHLSSCCGSSWQDCSEAERTAVRGEGEWSQFWANYNNSVAKVPVKSYYDQCPTPYRTENIDLADLEFSTDGSRKRSPDNLEDINYIIRNEGLRLTPRETQNMIKCAHILGNVLSKALERGCREKRVEMEVGEVEEEKEKEEDPELELKKKTMTLDLKETNEPAEEPSVRQHETVTTQTDISLPNTKSAPRIFEKILRQLSRTSLDEGLKALEAKAMENKALEVKEGKMDVKKEAKVEGKTEVKKEIKVEGKVDSKVEGKMENTAEGKKESKVEGKTEVKEEGKEEVKREN